MNRFPYPTNADVADENHKDIVMKTARPMRHEDSARSQSFYKFELDFTNIKDIQ